MLDEVEVDLSRWSPERAELVLDGLPGNSAALVAHTHTHTHSDVRPLLGAREAGLVVTS